MFKIVLIALVSLIVSCQWGKNRHGFLSQLNSDVAKYLLSTYLITEPSEPSLKSTSVPQCPRGTALLNNTDLCGKTLLNNFADFDFTVVHSRSRGRRHCLVTLPIKKTNVTKAVSYVCTV